VICVPKISVITPAYNAAATIGRTIASVQAQTFGDWEHIIIDDGSTDDTRAAVDAVRDTRLRYYYQTNQGPGEARNHGIRVSQGKYLIFLDAGDWWDNQCLATLLSRLEECGPGWASHCDWAYADNEGNVGKPHSSAFAAGEGLHTLLLYNPMAIHTVLIPRRAITAAGGFAREGMLEDWHLWLRLARTGYRFTHAPVLLAYYHRQPGSRSCNVELRKTERLATLDEFWAGVDSTDPLQSIRGESYGTAHVDMCVSYFGQGDVSTALTEFDAAVAHNKPVMATIDAYYRIAYAEQSAHGRATEQLGEDLDELTAAWRMNRLLAHIDQHYPSEEAGAAHRAAHAALGLACYNEGRYAAARTHLISAMSIEPRAIVDPVLFGTLAKTFIPDRLLDVGRRWKNRQ